MKKYLKKLLFISCLCMMMVMPSVSVAAGEIPNERLYPRLVDQADLLSDSEETELLGKLDEISERQKFDVAVVTMNSLGDATPETFADDFYDYNGYGMGNNADGALLLINMEGRDWHVTTCGFGITAITDAGLEYMAELVVEELSDGDYAEAFTVFADMCDDYVRQAREGEPYDIGNMPYDNISDLWLLPIALIIGLLTADIPTLIMRGKLKTVRRKSAASEYVIRESRTLRRETDRFLYHTVTRTRRETENKSSGGSTIHTSSSGRSHGGGGGKF